MYVKLNPPCDLGVFLRECVEGDGRDDVLLEADELEDSTRDEEVWMQLYKNRPSRKINSQRLSSREWDFQKTFSLTENQFSGKTYFYTIRPSLARVAALHVEVGHHAAEPGAVRRVQKVVARLGISALKEVRIGKNISEILPCIVTIFEGGEFV